MSIQAFNPKALSPIRDIVEEPNGVYLYTECNVLVLLAEDVWAITLPAERQRMLEHLWMVVSHDKSRRRFHSLREMLGECFAKKDDFLALANEKDFDGGLPLELHRWLALYVETNAGVSRARFSSQAFYRRYREAQGKG